MARKKIREFDAKQLIIQHCKAIALEHKSLLIDPATDIDALPDQHPWLNTTLLVAKPDQLFGKRGKNGLVKANVSFTDAKAFIQDKRNTAFTLGKATGFLTHFLIEPFVEHSTEYYLAFTSEREQDVIYFSEQGGVDIEDHWSSVRTIAVPTLEQLSSENIRQLATDPVILLVIRELFRIFRELDFTYLEFNPFIVRGNTIFLLDTVAHVDSCAQWRHAEQWKTLDFPHEFGKSLFSEEQYIEQLDAQSGASLKLTILNPRGKIWNILGGGGASIIYLDMLTNLGQGNEIANYGELSGNPSEQEAYEYAKALLALMVHDNQAEKFLFIVGGIANFTDVRETFKGFIRALGDYAVPLRDQHCTIFVRRGGPHEREGLQMMTEAGQRLGLEMYVYGPETSMPEVVRYAGKKRGIV